MAFKYSIIISGASATTGTIQTGSFAVLKPATTAGDPGSVCGVSEISLSGESTGSLVWRNALQRSQTTTIAAATVPASLSPFAPAAGSTSDGGSVAVASAPTAASAGGVLLHLGFNTFGGVYRWVAPPGSEILVTTAADAETGVGLVMWSVSGSPLVSGHI